VPDLAHHIRNLTTYRQQQGDESPPQRVGRQALGKRIPLSPHQVLVRALNRAEQDASPNVVALGCSTALGWEYEIVGAVEPGPGLVSLQLDFECRQQVNLASPGVGLGHRHAEPPCCEVHMPPPQRKRLADPEAREGQRHQQRPPRRCATVDPRVGVEFASCFKERFDLLRAVEPRPFRLRLLQPASLPPRRIACDQLALYGDFKNLPQPRERAVD
jgi:hypothetical protein